VGDDKKQYDPGGDEGELEKPARFGKDGARDEGADPDENAPRSKEGRAHEAL